MGVRYLNRFIQKKCPDALSRIHLRNFSGKRLAVDASIYLYRYSGEGALLENIYLMASVFRHYNIHAVFIFDGQPPPQKTELIEKRRKKKEEAKLEYDRLASIIKERTATAMMVSGGSTTTHDLDEMEEVMRELKKQFVRLRDCDISSVKELLVSFGFATIDAEGEADVLCANLSLKKRVDACLSDDMDMFVYGCPVVLRGLSLLNHTVVSYDTREIMKSLSLTQQEFKTMCVVCGTDYTTTTTTTTTECYNRKKTTSSICQDYGKVASPDTVYKQLTKYKTLTSKEKEKYHNSGGGFYDWYLEQQKEPHPHMITKSAITYLSNESMFDTNTNTDTFYKQLVVLNRDNIHKQRIIEIMTKEDFIFVESSPSDESIIKSLSSGTSSLTSSPIYGVGCTPEEREQPARVLAKEVYNISDVSSFQDLHMKASVKNKRKNRDRENSI
jgi:5'-3' exonuclease